MQNIKIQINFSLKRKVLRCVLSLKRKVLRSQYYKNRPSASLIKWVAGCHTGCCRLDAS